jgi:hypothetical protein
MGERNDVQELKVLASSLIQAEQLGVSVKSVLISQAEQLRGERKQRIEAKAMKAPVKMMLPTVHIHFPRHVYHPPRAGIREDKGIYSDNTPEETRHEKNPIGDGTRRAMYYRLVRRSFLDTPARHDGQDAARGRRDAALALRPDPQFLHAKSH